MSTVRLRLVTCNPGDHVKYDDIMRVLDGGQRDKPIHGAALQEMFNPKADAVLDKIVRQGWNVIRREPGKNEASPFVYDPRVLTLLRNDSFELLPAAKRLGKYNMEKYAVGGLFRFEPANRPIECFSIHNIQTQVGSRASSATVHNRRLDANLGDLDIPVFIGGDWNTKVNGRSMKPMDKWRYDQKIKPLPTHDIRPIDGWMWHGHHTEKHVVQYVTHWVDPKIDDHRPDYCEWDIKVKD